MIKSKIIRREWELFLVIIMLIPLIGHARGNKRDKYILENDFKEEFNREWKEFKDFFPELRNILKNTDQHFKKTISDKSIQELFDMGMELERDFKGFYGARDVLIIRLNRLNDRASRKKLDGTLVKAKIEQALSLLNHSLYQQLVDQIEKRALSIAKRKDELISQQAKRESDSFWEKIDRMDKSLEFTTLTNQMSKTLNDSVRQHTMGLPFLEKRFRALQDIAAMEKICGDPEKLKKEKSILWQGCEFLYASMKRAPTEMKNITKRGIKNSLLILKNKYPEKGPALAQIQELLVQENFLEALKKHDELLESIP